jgi:hypothetical protein
VAPETGAGFKKDPHPGPLPEGEGEFFRISTKFIILYQVADKVPSPFGRGTG